MAARWEYKIVPLRTQVISPKEMQVQEMYQIINQSGYLDKLNQIKLS